ncbi:MAG: mannosyl-3-phosphoglycerate synthase [Desulfurococcales archaeon]|nr:mannosyl-3-phosphoglycerate synthase [Desulfurococcales archaeon]
MIIEHPTRMERYGALRVFDVVRVVGLNGLGFHGGDGSLYFAGLDRAERLALETVFVVPVKDEDIMTLEGVISGIPQGSWVVIVSASSRSPIDRYRDEVNLARLLARTAGRRIAVVNQRDRAWGEVLRGTRLEPLLDDEGRVRRGKGEGMILGVIAAAALGGRYVAFVDSDNYVPGAVAEYSWAYLTGFSLAESGEVMVRIKWPYKAKLEVTGDLYLRRRGRVSMHTNSMLNYALSLIRRIETDIIKTANSGEHAMSIDLALRMEWAGAFAIESYQLTWLFEKCWLEEAECPFAPSGVTIYQVETRNPHIHAERGDEHIVDMIASSMGTIYYSKLGIERVRKRILSLLEDYDYEGEPPAPRVYPPPGSEPPRRVFEDYLAASSDAYISE